MTVLQPVVWHDVGVRTTLRTLAVLVCRGPCGAAWGVAVSGWGGVCLQQAGQPRLQGGTMRLAATTRQQHGAHAGRGHATRRTLTLCRFVATLAWRRAIQRPYGVCWGCSLGIAHTTPVALTHRVHVFDARGCFLALSDTAASLALQVEAGPLPCAPASSAAAARHTHMQLSDPSSTYQRAHAMALQWHHAFAPLCMTAVV